MSCGDARLVSPTFFTITESCSAVAGNVCAISSEPPPPGSAYATCANVWPGANGPSTVTVVPFTFTCGDDPSITVPPDAPFGSWKTNGDGGFTGLDEGFEMSSR